MLVVRLLIVNGVAVGASVLLMLIGYLGFFYFLFRYIYYMLKGKKEASLGASYSTTNYTSTDKKKNNRKAYLVFLFCFLLMLVAGTFEWMFWLFTVLWFCVGVGGDRIQTSRSGTTWSGQPVTIWTNYGAIKNTDGLPGGVCLSPSFMALHTIFYLLAIMLFHKADPYNFIFVIIGAILIIPGYFMFLRIFHGNTRSGWITMDSILGIITIVHILPDLLMAFMYSGQQ